MARPLRSVAAIGYIGLNRPPPKPLYDAQMGGAFSIRSACEAEPVVGRTSRSLGPAWSRCSSLCGVSEMLVPGAARSFVVERSKVASGQKNVCSFDQRFYDILFRIFYL